MGEKKPGKLTREQAFSPTGCGGGTEKACFALAGHRGTEECSLVTSPKAAAWAGLQLGWRANIDETDQKAWCPLGVLKDSKQS